MFVFVGGFMCLWLSAFDFVVRCLISCLFFGVGTFLVLEFCLFVCFIFVFVLRILCKTELVDRYCLNLVLSWNILFYPCMLIESFVGYNSLGWHLCSLRACMTSDQALLAFIVSVEKSGVILIGLPLYVTWPFFIAVYNNFSLYCVFSVLIIT